MGHLHLICISFPSHLHVICIAFASHCNVSWVPHVSPVSMPVEGLFIEFGEVTAGHLHLICIFSDHLFLMKETYLSST